MFADRCIASASAAAFENDDSATTVVATDVISVAQNRVAVVADSQIEAVCAMTAAAAAVVGAAAAAGAAAALEIEFDNYQTRLDCPRASTSEQIKK